MGPRDRGGKPTKSSAKPVVAHVVAMFALLSHPGPASGAEPALLKILWVAIPGSALDPPVVSAAQFELNVILDRLGARAEWRQGSIGAASVSDEIRVAVVPRPLGSLEGTRTMASVDTSTPIVSIWLYRDNLLWAAQLEDGASRTCSPRCKRLLGVVIGRALAHEIVHAVLPELDHAQRGLMARQLDGRIKAPAWIDAQVVASFRDRVDDFWVGRAAVASQD